MEPSQTGVRMGRLEFVCVDCETTGLDVVQNRIIEVAVKQFSYTEMGEMFESLIDPRCPIPEETIKIHHITPEMVEKKPLIEAVLPRILELIGDRIIVGHGVGFDIDLLIEAATRAGISQTLRQNRVIDTLRMARSYGESPTNSLEKLRIHFNIASEGAHRAMNDVVVNIEVFKRLARDYKNVDAIFERLSKPIALPTMPLGKHKGRPMGEVPLDYLLWAANKDFDQDLLYTIRSEINRRKKGNSFAQASNPFSGL